MFTEQFFDLLLDFGDDSKVIAVKSAPESSEVDIYGDYIGREKVYDHAPVRRWRHLDTMQFKTFINACLPRVKLIDGTVKTISPPWADKHTRHSFLFESAVISLLTATKNQTQTANLMRCKFDPRESDHAQRDDTRIRAQKDGRKCL